MGTLPKSLSKKCVNFWVQNILAASWGIFWRTSGYFATHFSTSTRSQLHMSRQRVASAKFMFYTVSTIPTITTEFKI